jgi:hypothetical protein
VKRVRIPGVETHLIREKEDAKKGEAFFRTNSDTTDALFCAILPEWLICIFSLNAHPSAYLWRTAQHRETSKMGSTPVRAAALSKKDC